MPHFEKNGYSRPHSCQWICMPCTTSLRYAWCMMNPVCSDSMVPKHQHAP